MMRVNAILYQAVGTVKIPDAANVARARRMRELMGLWMRNIDEVKWRSVM